MIQEFVDRFMQKTEELRAKFTAAEPDSYADVVQAVVEMITDDEYGAICPDRIHEIDDGEYQGTLLYVIASKDYQPDDYWVVYVNYGSCSGCDTLQSIQECPEAEERVNDYMTLALHIVQGLKKI